MMNENVLVMSSRFVCETCHRSFANKPTLRTHCWKSKHPLPTKVFGNIRPYRKSASETQRRKKTKPITIDLEETDTASSQSDMEVYLKGLRKILPRPNLVKPIDAVLVEVAGAGLARQAETLGQTGLVCQRLVSRADATHSNAATQTDLQSSNATQTMLKFQNRPSPTGFLSNDAAVALSPLALGSSGAEPVAYQSSASMPTADQFSQTSPVVTSCLGCSELAYNNEPDFTAADSPDFSNDVYDLPSNIGEEFVQISSIQPTLDCAQPFYQHPIHAETQTTSQLMGHPIMSCSMTQTAGGDVPSVWPDPPSSGLFDEPIINSLLHTQGTSTDDFDGLHFIEVYDNETQTLSCTRSECAFCKLPFDHD